MKNIFLPLLALCTLAIAACSVPEAPAQSAEEIRSAQVAASLNEATRQVAPPAIINYQQLRFQTLLYELQDQELATFTYYANLDGDLIYVCPSVGYGMNASIQITNPERSEWRNRYESIAGITVPQPEPNGLYMPEGLSATYVMCSDPDGSGELRPMYVEDNIIVSPFRLPAVRSLWPE